MLRKLVIASGNKGKIKEIKSFLSEFYEIVSQEEMESEVGSKAPDVEENGKDYIENALLKARACSSWCGLPVLSDDSGLEVEALNGEPGLYSARYAGEDVTFQDNINKLLVELADNENRKAKFIAVLVLLDTNGEHQAFRGELEGNILKESRGAGGFGYDPVFETNTGKTLAEIKGSGEEFKTHRVLALEKMRSESL